MNYALNLMTPQARRREICRTRFRQWSLIFLSTLGILATLTGVHYYHVRESNLKLQALETTLEPINHLKEANKRLAKQIESVRNREQFILALSERSSSVTLLGLVGMAVEKVGDRVFLKKLELAKTASDSLEKFDSELVVDLIGASNNKKAADELADVFRALIPAGKVEVTANNQSRIKNVLTHDFSLNCTLNN